MAKLSTILDQIDAGSMLLPEFQRGYVWNREQIRGLMRSLYHGYPVGALLVWETDGAVHSARGVGQVASGPKQLLLDGQQRVTTLYSLIRGRPPAFYQGDPEMFRGLHFNVETQVFQFLAPVTAKGDPLWVDVSRLFTAEPGTQYDQLLDQPWMRPNLGIYLERLLQLQSVLQREFYVDRITGPDKTVDVVVDIFNRVNSGGTKLSKGDLALARICAEWGEARPSMRALLDGWRLRQLTVTEDWLLRNVNALATGKAPFAALSDVSTDDFRTSLSRAAQNIDHFLDLLTGRLGLDHDRVLTSGRLTFPIITRLLHKGGGKFADGAEADKALYWFVHAALRGRYAGSTETALAKDLEIVDKSGVDGLIAGLRRSQRRGLGIEPDDFDGLGRGSRAYPLLYMISRVGGARDLATNRPLDEAGAGVQLMEIFPKDLLYRAGYSRGEVNAVANFAFVTPSTVTSLGKRAPAEYMPYVPAETLRSQWIPADAELWTVERYREFLAARRALLAADTHDFLERLVGARVEWTPALAPLPPAPDSGEADARAAQLRALAEELTVAGYASPELDVEIIDPDSGRPLAVAEAFWPNGLQAGQGKPVVLELDPDEADLPRLAEIGYEVFTSVEALRGHVQRRNEIASGDREDEGEITATEAPPVQADVEAEHPETRAPSAASAAPREESLLEARLVELAELWSRELKYNPRRFVADLAQYGAREAVARQLAGSMPGDAFVFLWERQRLDVSIEALVLDPRFAELFSEPEREIARRRLDEFGFDLDVA